MFADAFSKTVELKTSENISAIILSYWPQTGQSCCFICKHNYPWECTFYYRLLMYRSPQTDRLVISENVFLLAWIGCSHGNSWCLAMQYNRDSETKYIMGRTICHVSRWYTRSDVIHFYRCISLWCECLHVSIKGRWQNSNGNSCFETCRKENKEGKQKKEKT